MDEAGADSTNNKLRQSARLNALSKLLTDPDAPQQPGKFKDPVSSFGKRKGKPEK